jgi:hypothetical protein
MTSTPGPTAPFKHPLARLTLTAAFVVALVIGGILVILWGVPLVIVGTALLIGALSGVVAPALVVGALGATVLVLTVSLLFALPESKR